jgi:nucleoside-diphosphate-sugar epimerase
VTGTLNLCRAALKAGCRRFVHTSTSEVYGTAQYVPIDENHPLNAQSPYSASKIAADALCTSFYHTFGLPLVILRPFNTYGPCQSARAVIPTIITQILMGEKEIKLGSLHPLRDLNYVEDTCAAFYALACAEPKGEVFNAGSGREISIGDLARLIASLMGADVVFTVDPQRIRPESSEVNRLCCDSSKLFRATGFCNSHTLEQGLLKTIEWFKKPDNINKYKAGIYNV